MNFKELFNQGLIVITLRVFGAAITFFSMLFFARILDLEEYGIYSLSLTIITLISVFARFGLDNVNLKQVAAHKENDKKISLGYIYSSFQFIILIGTILTIIIFFYSNEIVYTIFNKPSLSQPLQYFSFLIIPSALLYLLSASFKALGHPAYAIFIQNILVPVFIIIFVYLIYLMDHLDITSIILFVIVSHIIAIVLFSLSLFINSNTLEIKNISFRQLSHEGWPMLLISSGSLIIGYADIIILGIFCSESDVAIYTVASKSVMITSLILVAINSITAPLYAKFYHQKDFISIEKLAQKASALLFIIAICFVLILYIFSEYIMSLFGDAYILGAPILIILSVGQFFILVSGSVSYLLSMTGKENKFKNILLTSAVLNIILNLILVQHYGGLGVAYATVFSAFVWNLWSMYEVKKHLGFWTLNISSLYSKKEVR